MVRTSLVVVAVLASLLGVPAAPADATTGDLAIGDWRPVSGAERQLLSDGERFVVTRAGARKVRLRDTATSEARRLVPPPCDNGPSLPAALGSGMLVWDCPSRALLGGHTLYVDDLAGARRFVPPSLPGFQALDSSSHDGSRFRVVSAGRHWIYLVRTGYHFADDVLVPFSGDQIAPMPAVADITVDPDRATAVRRLCAGIRRPVGALELGQLPFGVVTYHRPYAISGQGRLRRCTGAPAVPRGQVVAALSDYHLSWATGRLVRIRSTQARRTVRRTAPGTVRSIALTRDFLYISTGTGMGRRTYRAPLLSR